MRTRGSGTDPRKGLGQPRGEGEDSLPMFVSPAFLGAEKSAVFVGTATHAAMQFLPLECELDEAEATDYLAALCKQGQLSPEQAEAADAQAVAWFTQDPLFARMRQARRLERELPFSYPMDAQMLYGIDAEETVLLQGVLDACFLEDDAWVIVDYKTDRVRGNETAEHAAGRHTQQLRLYALALGIAHGTAGQGTLCRTLEPSGGWYLSKAVFSVAQ